MALDPRHEQLFATLPRMSTELERERLQLASYMGLTKRLRGQLRLDRDPDRQQRHRAEWPGLWEAIDEIIEHVDRDFPPYGSKDRGLFGPDKAR